MKKKMKNDSLYVSYKVYYFFTKNTVYLVINAIKLERINIINTMQYN